MAFHPSDPSGHTPKPPGKPGLPTGPTAAPAQELGRPVLAGTLAARLAVAPDLLLLHGKSTLIYSGDGGITWTNSAGPVLPD